MEQTTHDDDHNRTSLSGHQRSEHAAPALLQAELSPLPKREPLDEQATSLYRHAIGMTGCHDVDTLRRVAAGIRSLSEASDLRKHDSERGTARLQQEIDGVIARWRASQGEVPSDR